MLCIHPIFVKLQLPTCLLIHFWYIYIIVKKFISYHKRSVLGWSSKGKAKTAVSTPNCMDNSGGSHDNYIVQPFIVSGNSTLSDLRLPAFGSFYPGCCLYTEFQIGMCHKYDFSYSGISLWLLHFRIQFAPTPCSNCVFLGLVDDCRVNVPVFLYQRRYKGYLVCGSQPFNNWWAFVSW